MFGWGEMVDLMEERLLIVSASNPMTCFLSCGRECISMQFMLSDNSNPGLQE